MDWYKITCPRRDESVPIAPLAVPCGPQSTTKATTLEDYACTTQLIVVSGEVKFVG